MAELAARDSLRAVGLHKLAERFNFLSSHHVGKVRSFGSPRFARRLTVLFSGQNELAISQNMVRADVFQKCCHCSRIERGKQISGDLKFYELTSRFEPNNLLSQNR